MNENKNKTFIFLGIFAVIIVIAIGFILGSKLTNKEDKKDKTETPEEKIDIDYLLSLIPSYDIGHGYSVYQDKLVIVDEIPAEKLGVNVYNDLKNHSDDIIARYGHFEGEPIKSNYDNVDEYFQEYEKKCIESGNLHSGYYCYVKGNDEELEDGYVAYSEDTIKAIYKNFYGENYPYVAPKYIETGFGVCNYTAGYYLCEGGGGYGPSGAYNLGVYISSEKKDDQIHLYEDNLYIEETCVVDANYEEPLCTSHVYTDYTKTTKIGEVNNEADVYDTFKDQAIRYKHIFKKNSDGTYYWYSVEPVK